MIEGLQISDSRMDVDPSSPDQQYSEEEANLLGQEYEEPTADQSVLAGIMKALWELTERVNNMKERGNTHKRKAAHDTGEEKRTRAETEGGNNQTLSTAKAQSAPTTESHMTEDSRPDMKAAFSTTQEFGALVSANIAEQLTGSFGQKLKDPILNEKLKKYPIPSNCQCMGVSRTKQAIFSALKPYVCISNTQRTLSMAAVKGFSD